MTYKVKRILNIDDRLGKEILWLLDYLKDPEMSSQGYLDKFIQHTHKIGLFGIFQEKLTNRNQLRGFLFAQAPMSTYPNRGYLPVTAIYPGVPLKISRQAYDMAVRWLEEQGAKYVWGWTKRSPRAIHRLYGFDVVRERQVIAPIQGHEEHKNIERDTSYV